jgi:hypothetical protein
LEKKRLDAETFWCYISNINNKKQGVNNMQKEKENINYFITKPIDDQRNTQTYVDRVIRNIYANEHNKKRNENKSKNYPVQEWMFTGHLLNKLYIKKSWMSDVSGYTTGVKSTICVIASPEIVAHLINKGVDPKRITFISDNQLWKVDQAVEMGVDKSRTYMLKSLSSYQKEQTMAMIKNQLSEKQYDLTIMNPPYDLTKEFMEIADTITKANGQIAVICDAKQANSLDWNKVSDYEYTHNSFAGVNLNTIVTVINKNGVDETLLTDIQGNKIVVASSEIKVAPTTNLDIWKNANRLMNENLSGIECSNGGTLHAREMVKVPKGIKVVPTVGRADEPLNVVTLDSSLASKTFGHDQDMVIFGADYDAGKIGPIKHKPVGISIPNRVHGIVVKNPKEAKQVIEYLNSDAVKQLVSVIKITSKNSKGVFKRIPHWTNSKTWMNYFA